MYRVSRLRRLLRSTVTTALSLSLITSAWVPDAAAQSEPDERLSATISRTSASPLQIRDELRKNVYRPEVRQVPYEVEVPYQDTEEYEVQVPYQATETYEEQIPYQDVEYYTEEVPYYDTETYTERVPYTRSEAYTDTETYYENEYQCRDVTRYERQCRNEPVCHTEPTTEKECKMERLCRIGRDGREVCVDKEVCRQIGGGRRVCNDNQVCRDVPVRDNECGYVSVPRTRTVTKYRDVTDYRSETRTRTVTKYRSETRTRTVTKYRSETRTRTVTKYRTETRTREVTRHRTETRCCKPETYQAFDHQFKVAVVLNFTADSRLLQGEREEFEVVLTGDEAKPDIKVESMSRIFKYEVVNKKAVRGEVAVDLKRVPAYTPDMLGKGTIMNLKLLPAQGAAGWKAVFVDTGLKPRIATEYTLTIQDAVSGQVVAQAKQASDGSQKPELAVAEALSPTLDYVVSLAVLRAGINLTAPVQFTETAKHEFRRFSPEEVGLNSVSNLVIKQAGDRFIVRFKDMGTNEFIDTRYQVTVTNSKTSEAVFTVEKNAREVTTEPNTPTLEIPKSAVDTKVAYAVSVRVLRQGVVLTGPVDFEISGKIDLSDWTEVYKDQSRVTLVGLSGKTGMTKLVIKDDTPLKDEVVTFYQIEVKRGATTLGKNRFRRVKFQKDPSNPEFTISLDLLVSESDLRSYAKPGQELTLIVTVQRDGAKTGKIEFARSATLRVP